MYKLGLKLWSSNTDSYLEEAKRLYQEGVYSYIELYIVPDTIDSLKKWANLKNEFSIPFNLHAPHFVHDVNLAKPEYEAHNIEVFNQVTTFSKELDAEFVIVHSGMDGSIEETIRQLKIINLENMIIENKPFKPVPNKVAADFCRGATVNEIEKVMDEIGCGFCLDIGHAMCSANSQKIEPYEYLEAFNSLKPSYYHFSDNYCNNEFDTHFHFGKGNYDFSKILGIIDSTKNISIETNKDSKFTLDDFAEDVKWLKNLK